MMEQNFLDKELKYVHDAATYRELSRVISGSAVGSHRDCNMLKQMVSRISFDNIPWSMLRTLYIFGKANAKCNDALKTAGITPGIYVSPEGTQLIMILLKQEKIHSFMRLCREGLIYLNLYNTTLTHLDLSDLSSLQCIQLRGNDELSEISGVSQLTSLRKLDLFGCKNLVQLPPLENLPKLENVDLRNCSKLKHLPAIRNLPVLTSLLLGGCVNLTQATLLENLPKVISLDFSGCTKLTQLPQLKNLPQLANLDLSGCVNLAQAPLLDNLPKLTYLDFSGCVSLTELSSKLKISQLIKLDLSECGIKELPAEIRKMTSLRTLNLSGLKLLDLPDWLPEIADDFFSISTEVSKQTSNEVAQEVSDIYEIFRIFGSIHEKARVDLTNTTVEEIPDMSIFEQPYEVIAEWFRNRKSGNMRILNEIKVVFLGDGEAGKSHTIARLMNDGGEPDFAVFDGQSTPGIVIRNKEYDLDSRKIQVHYWDFGGQEIMHSMHRIFLTGRTMYVILLNARDDTQGDRAKYWLHNVKSFAPNAPVLMVLNKIDQNENASVDEVDLRGRYDKLTQVVKLSALTFSQKKFNETFTNVLLDEIQKTGFLDAQWPVSWTQVKDRLENMATHYIMGDAYEGICAEYSVDRNRKDLLHWFNDLGVSFCCCDEKDYKLKDYVILRPDWITNALYIILFNKLADARNGRIPHRSIYDILENFHKNPQIRCTLPTARYNANDIQYVLGVMRKFNLSLADGEDDEFIPMLCQRNSTVDVQSYRKNADILEFSMEFDYLPPNLLHRLMVERHDELDMANVWRTGAKFQMKELGLSAVVVIDDNVLRFFIRHTDPMHRPNTYLTMLKANVDRIVNKMSLKAPTCQLIYKLDGRQDAFDLEMLKTMQEAGETHIFSMTWRRRILILDILNQSAPDGLEDEMKLLDGIRRACRSIQDEHKYRLDENRKGSDMEDFRNRRVRDDLLKLGFNVSDQSQRGSSSTGRSIGELDLLVLDERGESWSIIEALRISDGAKTAWNEHLDKLLNKYNSRGLPRVYLLTYVDADPKAFEHIWEGYQKHIKAYDPGTFTYSSGSFVDLNDVTTPLNIRTAKCLYSCGGEPITVYHIFARIPTPNE